MKRLSKINLSYPYASINTTQATGHYTLDITISKGTSVVFNIKERDLDNLEGDIHMIREHQKWLKEKKVK